MKWIYINQQKKRNMLFKNKKNILYLIAILLIFISCNKTKETKSALAGTINFDHFNHLYKEIDLNEKKSRNYSYL